MIARHLSRRDLGLVFGLALATRLAALVLLQPRLGADGVGYLSSAHALVASWPSALASLPLAHAPLYSILLVPGVLLPLDTPWLVTLAQTIVGAATAVVLMRLATRETGSRVAGLGAGCIAAVQPTFVFWTTYVLSETVFLLLIAVAADWALLAPRSRRPLLAGALVGALGLLTIAARPTGAPFALAVLLTLIVVAWPRPDRLRAVVVGFLAPCVLLVGIGLASVLALGAALPPIGPTAARVADWAASGIKNGLLETDQGRGTSGVDLDVSPPPIVDSLPLEQRPEFLQDGPLAFATHHPEFVVQQTVRKVRLFWSPVLPQYSLAHALGASVYFSMLYALAALGAAHAQRSKDLVVLCAGCIILFTLTSLVTIVDYDQRYRLPVELFLIPLAAIGLGWLRERWPLVPVPTRRRSGRRTTVEPLAQ